MSPARPASADDAGVWGALADPTRRAILDMLREQPRTTGELCAAFPLSRFAVMKHLDALENAGLIAVRRAGRERWNHLNAIPLQRIVERWLAPYEAQWAAALLRLQRHIETTEGESHMDSSQKTANHLSIEQEITLAASPARVFTALTRDIGAWWGAPYLMSPQAQQLILDPRIGGQFYEDWGDGQGALWATITALRSDTLLELSGSIGMDGAVYAKVVFTLTAHDQGTTLRLSHQAYGMISAAQHSGYTAGWSDLLDTRLRAYIERGELLGLASVDPEKARS